MFVTVVQWSRSVLKMQTNRVRLPATQLSVSLYLFFPLFGLFSFFNTIFPFGLFFLLFLLQTLLVMHLDQYIF